MSRWPCKQARLAFPSQGQGLKAGNKAAQAALHDRGGGSLQGAVDFGNSLGSFESCNGSHQGLERPSRAQDAAIQNKISDCHLQEQLLTAGGQEGIREGVYGGGKLQASE